MQTQYDRIQELCRQHDTNITAMCRELDITRSALSELHAGRTRSLSSDTILKIADYFATSPAYIINGSTGVTYATKSDVNDYLEALRTRPEVKMLFSIAKDASKEEVEKAVKIIEAYLDSSKT